MKIQVNDGSTPLGFKATRAKDSTTMWIDITGGDTELTVFIDPAEAKALGESLVKHATDALQIREVLIKVLS